MSDLQRAMNKISDKLIEYAVYAVCSIGLIALLLFPAFLLMTVFNMFNDIIGARKITLWEAIWLKLVI